MAVAIDASRVEEILDKYGEDSSALIQILLDVQREYRWLPKEALARVSERLDVPLDRIYQIGTFYKAFSLVPRGRHEVQVCMGTACHVRGAPRLLDRVSELLKLPPNSTSSDLKFTLSTVNCLGCCALGPVLVVDGDYHSKPSTEDLKRVFDACE